MPQPGPIHQLLQATGDLRSGAALLTTFWALINCFLGYVVWRAFLVLYMLLLGAVLGEAVVGWVRPETATGLDYFVACAAGAIILGLLAWLVDRPAFALGLGVATAYVVAGCLGGTASIWAVLPGAIAGLGAAAAGYTRRKVTIISVTAVGGAGGAVFWTASLIAGGGGALGAAIAGPPGRAWLGVLLVLIATGIATAGIYSQVRLAKVLRTALCPQDDSGGGRGRRRSGGTAVRPRFTKV